MECSPSQNLKGAEVGRGLWRSSSLVPLLQHSHLELAAQKHVQMAFEYIKG